VLPSSYTDFLYTGDLFRIIAVAVWAFGAVREIARYQADSERAAVLETRRQVARDIHDGVAQELALISSLTHGLETTSRGAQDKAEIMESVQRALDETRGAITALRRPLEEPVGRSLTATAQELAERLGAHVEIHVDDALAVPPAWEEALPRIVREAVANAVRHGGAATVSVRLTEADRIRLRVQDDGEGFDPSSLGLGGGYGLIGIRERTESLGGDLTIDSRPGHGTCVEVRLP
jgi:signal transduction histidine kinase